MSLKLLQKLWLRSVGVLENTAFRLGLQSTEKLVLPTFLGIGAQRSGTTWLYENLRLHPEILLASPKELHFFDRRLWSSLRRYSSYFEASTCAVRGEITPAYSIIPIRTIRFIRHLMPDIRIILLLRDPVTRSWSHAMKDLVTAEHQRVEDIGEERLRHFLHTDPCRRRSSYRDIISNWLSVFPREQLFVGFFDDVENHPVSLLRSVFAHLGVRVDIDLTDFPIDKTITRRDGVSDTRRDTRSLMPASIEQLLVELYREEIEALYREFGRNVESWRRPANSS